MSVYGGFITAFPELLETIQVWKETKEDSKLLRVIYIPSKGEEIKRRKYTSGNTSLDIINEDQIYVKTTLKSKINVGDYFIRLIDNKIIMRVTGQVPYSKAADYIVYTVQKVTGDTIDDTEKLEVKEGYFA